MPTKGSKWVSPTEEELAELTEKYMAAAQSMAMQSFAAQNISVLSALKHCASMRHCNESLLFRGNASSKRRSWPRQITMLIHILIRGGILSGRSGFRIWRGLKVRCWQDSGA